MKNKQVRSINLLLGSTKNLTEFQRKVYSATLLIPKGKVTTYKLLATFIECNSAQAIGQALKANPFAPTIPCHRVIASTLKIGGFKGKRQGKEIALKIKLLQAEGVIFANGTLVNKSRIHFF